MYQNYLELLAQKKLIDASILQMQCNIYEKHQAKLDEKETGTIRIEDNGFVLTVIKRENITVDQGLASVVQIGFNKKYALSKSAYNKLSDEEKKRVDECLTTSSGKPSFKVEEL